MSDVSLSRPSTWPRWLQVAVISGSATAVGVAAYFAYSRSQEQHRTSHLKAAARTASGSTDSREKKGNTARVLSPSSSSSSSPPEADREADEHTSQKAKASALRKQGNDAYKARRFDEAIETYTKALEVSPVIDEDCAVFYCNRAACYLLQRNYDKVIDDCTAALRLRPCYTKALNRRAQAFENKRKLRSALKDYTTIVLIDKFENEAASKAVERLLENLGRQGATKYLESRPKKLPAQKVIVSFFENYDPKSFGPIETEDVESLTEMLCKDPSDGDTKARLCKALFQEKRYDEAYKACISAVDRLQEMKLDDERKETLVHMMNLLGSFQMLRLELQEAEKTFQEALRFNKRNANTLIRLAACRLELGKSSEALADFTNAQRMEDKNADVFFHKAQAHISMGAAVMAFSDLQSAINLDCKIYGPYVHLALLHLQTQDPTSAIDLMKKAAQKFPENSTVQSYLGEIYSAAGDAASAEACFDKAIELDAKNANPYVHKGMALIQQGKMQEGLSLVNKAVEIDDACEAAYARLAQFHVQREEYSKALECYDKAIAVTHAGQELVAFFSCKEACIAQQAVVKAHPNLRPSDLAM
eukprot:gene2033-5106_t